MKGHWNEGPVSERPFLRRVLRQLRDAGEEDWEALSYQDLSAEAAHVRVKEAGLKIPSPPEPQTPAPKVTGPRFAEARDELIYILRLAQKQLEEGKPRLSASNIEKALKLLTSGTVGLTPDVETDIRRALGPLDHARDSLGWELEQKSVPELKRVDCARAQIGELVGPALPYSPPRGLPGHTPVDKVVGGHLQAGPGPISVGGLSDTIPDQTVTLEQHRVLERDRESAGPAGPRATHSSEAAHNARVPPSDASQGGTSYCAIGNPSFGNESLAHHPSGPGAGLSVECHAPVLSALVVDGQLPDIPRAGVEG